MSESVIANPNQMYDVRFENKVVEGNFVDRIGIRHYNETRSEEDTSNSNENNIQLYLKTAEQKNSQTLDNHGIRHDNEIAIETDFDRKVSNFGAGNYLYEAGVETDAELLYHDQGDCNAQSELDT